jgi:F-type H+-transporting ATPase subunit delta
MARPGTAAHRYAEAAFELAEREDAFDRWRDDLHVAAEVAADESVTRILDNPAIPLADREELLARLLQPRLSRPVFNLVRLLAQRSTLELLPRISAEYDRLWNAHAGIVSATVSSALPLTADEDAAVRAKVATLTGSKVEIQTVVDPALIGGLTVRIGDRLIDASVRGRLERLREELLAGSR